MLFGNPAAGNAARCKKILAIAAPVLAAGVLLAILLTAVLTPEDRYRKALSRAEVGDTVVFGSYEQDNDPSGEEGVEWLVLAKEDGRMLLISRYALDCRKYHDALADVTWETCSLRAWLNGTFFSSAFSAEEQELVAAARVPADPNPSYGAPAGNDTTDRVFLLSIAEADRYFASDGARMCEGTEYCRAHGAYRAANGNSLWRLRSPGNGSDFSAGVDENGSVYPGGYLVDYDRLAVRPAMWIDLGS